VRAIANSEEVKSMALLRIDFHFSIIPEGNTVLLHFYLLLFTWGLQKAAPFSLDLPNLSFHGTLVSEATRKDRCP